MRRTGLVLAGLALLAAGCASPAAYWQNRWLDLADCFTLELGVGGPVGVELGASDWFTLAAGWGASVKYGFVGRHRVGPDRENGEDWHSGIYPFVPFLPTDMLCAEECGREHVQGWKRNLLLGLAHLFVGSSHLRHENQCYSPRPRDPVTALRVSETILGINMTALTEKNRGRDVPAKLADSFDLDVSGALLVAARIGLRLGQIPDFLLGWTGLDIAGDDAAGKSPPSPTPQAPQKDGTP
ncbi:MAG: hypothetical protein FJ291_04430 [Planctomycetes bacterium]|nr:hypothetical protein [Planctomycetota bacterium]